LSHTAVSERGARWMGKAWYWVLLGLLLVLALGAVALVAMWKEPKEQPPFAKLGISAEEARQLQRQWADYLGQRVVVTDELGIRLVLVPRGAGMALRHEAAVDWPIRLGTTEVTRGQFRAFVEAIGYVTDAEKANSKLTWRSPGYHPVSDEDPIVQVSWSDAGAFCHWLTERHGRTYRLPTPEEWRWACRAGAATAFPFGADPGDLEHHAWIGANSDGRPHPVGQLRPNVWGFSDMLGNVQEWCDAQKVAGGKVFRRAQGSHHRTVEL